jgi:radical SAM protein with 4Fe4S-binding SPASM domain
MEKIAKFLSQYTKYSNFFFYFSPVVGCFNYAYKKDSEFRKIYVKALKLQIKYIPQFKYYFKKYLSENALFKPITCTFYDKNSVVIAADAQLYRCENISEWIGSVNTKHKITSLPLKNEIDERCKRCKILPICGGGCQYRKKSGLKFNKHNGCSSYIFLIDEMFKLVFKHKFN